MAGKSARVYGVENIAWHVIAGYGLDARLDDG